MRIRTPWVEVFASLVLLGCASSPAPAPRSAPAPAVDNTNEIRNQLVGTWQFISNGVTVEVTYTPTTVAMAGVPPTPYTLVGNEITVDILGPKTSIIEFRGKDEMTQTNKTDGQRYVFKRKRSA
ncbi:MAG: hypothetical protein ABW110_16835 [Steroidobacteraceae bacterium]